MKEELTGNWFLKKGWFGTLQVMVEIKKTICNGHFELFYRKAKLEDIINLNIKCA